VNLGGLTVQTMIFEPATLKLHLAIGSCPSSALPMKELDLKPLFTNSSLEGPSYGWPCYTSTYQ